MINQKEQHTDLNISNNTNRCDRQKQYYIYKKKRSTQGPCSANYSMSLSLPLTQMNAQNFFSLGEFFKKYFS